MIPFSQDPGRTATTKQKRKRRKKQFGWWFGSSLVGTNTIDIYHPNLSSMRLWGSRHIEIAVIQWGDWDRTLNILAGRTQYAHTRKMYYAARAKVKSGKVVRN